MSHQQVEISFVFCQTIAREASRNQGSLVAGIEDQFTLAQAIEGMYGQRHLVPVPFHCSALLSSVSVLSSRLFCGGKELTSEPWFIYFSE